MNNHDKAPTQANGYPKGRPADRDAEDLDSVIQKAIERLPPELRLYPDIYSWSVVDAVKAHLEASI